MVSRTLQAGAGRNAFKSVGRVVASRHRGEASSLPVVMTWKHAPLRETTGDSGCVLLRLRGAVAAVIFCVVKGYKQEAELVVRVAVCRECSRHRPACRRNRCAVRLRCGENESATGAVDTRYSPGIASAQPSPSALASRTAGNETTMPIDHAPSPLRNNAVSDSS